VLRYIVLNVCILSSANGISTTESKGGKKHDTYKNRRKANWLGHISVRNRLLKHVIARKIEVTEDEEEDVSNYWLKLTLR